MPAPTTSPAARTLAEILPDWVQKRMCIHRMVWLAGEQPTWSRTDGLLDFVEDTREWKKLSIPDAPGWLKSGADENDEVEFAEAVQRWLRDTGRVGAFVLTVTVGGSGFIRSFYGDTFEAALEAALAWGKSLGGSR